MKKLIILSLIATIGLAGCNKTNTYSKRLSGDTWTVKKLTINGVDETDHLPELTFSDCDIYDEVCMGEWHLEDEHAEFAWQFDENGDVFTISNQSEAEHDHEDEHDHDHGDEEEEEHIEPVDQCETLSGTYDVKEMKRKTMTLESRETIGLSGTLVTLELEKN